MKQRPQFLLQDDAQDVLGALLAIEPDEATLVSLRARLDLPGGDHRLLNALRTLDERGLVRCSRRTGQPLDAATWRLSPRGREVAADLGRGAPVA